MNLNYEISDIHKRLHRDAVPSVFPSKKRNQKEADCAASSDSGDADFESDRTGSTTREQVTKTSENIAVYESDETDANHEPQEHVEILELALESGTTDANVQCAVPMCKSQTGGHFFPRDEGLCFNWRIAIRRVDKNGKLWSPKPLSVVCRNHFKSMDYGLHPGVFSKLRLPFFIVMPVTDDS